MAHGNLKIFLNMIGISLKRFLEWPSRFRPLVFKMFAKIFYPVPAAIFPRCGGNVVLFFFAEV
jgi:hypothetical protein